MNNKNEKIEYIIEVVSVLCSAAAIWSVVIETMELALIAAIVLFVSLGIGTICSDVDGELSKREINDNGLVINAFRET